MNNAYHETRLDNGLKIKIISKPTITKQSAKIIVNCGSNQLNKFCPGVAHFLEHVKFASKNGDWFDDFSNNGADANAYTNYNETAYYFNCGENFLKNLKNLITMVTTFDATPETIKKEMQIITQEILMYDQIPEWRLNNIILNNISSNGYGIDIAGKISDIENIDLQMLKNIFDKYYVINNMTLLIVTNIDYKLIIDEVEKLTNHLQRKPCDNNFIQETNSISREMEVVDDNSIHNKITSCIYKCNYPSDIIKNYLALKIFIKSSFTKINKAYIDKVRNNDINETFTTELFITKDICSLWFEIYKECDDIVKILEELYNLSEDNFNIAKKQELGQLLRLESYPEKFLDFIYFLDQFNINFSQYLKIANGINYDEYKTLINEILKNCRHSTVIMK